MVFRRLISIDASQCNELRTHNLRSQGLRRSVKRLEVTALGSVYRNVSPERVKRRVGAPPPPGRLNSTPAGKPPSQLQLKQELERLNRLREQQQQRRLLAQQQQLQQQQQLRQQQQQPRRQQQQKGKQAKQVQTKQPTTVKFPGAPQNANNTKSRLDWQRIRDWLVVEMQDGLLEADLYEDLMRSCDLQKEWRPQVTLFWELGLRKPELRKLVANRRDIFSLGVPTISSKLKWLREEIGLTKEDLVRLLVKFPRILEYKTERTIRPRLEFLKANGVEHKDLCKVVMRTPQLLELRLAETLTPRIEFMRDTIGVPQEAMGKIISRYPSTLTATIESMEQRVQFLEGLGLSITGIAKAVVAHPPVLTYSTDAMTERVRYLRSIGMSRVQIAQTVVKLPQLFCLDVQNNLVPKYHYLTSQLGGNVSTVCIYPAYFSLSLSNRIIVRHRYLQMVKATTPSPFPMNYLKLSDKAFVARAGTSLNHFEEFREQFIARAEAGQQGGSAGANADEEEVRGGDDYVPPGRLAQQQAAQQQRKRGAGGGLNGGLSGMARQSLGSSRVGDLL